LPQIVAEWEKAWEQFAEAPMQVRLRALLETARHLHGLLAIHLDKEDHVLFPLVRKLLRPQDWAEVQGRAQVLVL
jgi:hemerythrin-like domain-containing protein